VHVEGDVNPLRDIETIRLELIFADLESVEKKLQRAEKAAKADKAQIHAIHAAEKVKAALEAGQDARSCELNDDERAAMQDCPLLTMKPVIYAANIKESEVADPSSNPHLAELEKFAAEQNSGVISISAQIENETAQLEGQERLEFLSVLGIKKSGLDQLISAGYELLSLISYLTAGKPEVRAWTITRGTKAPQAAGKIHTDFERGFIRAEVVGFDTLMQAGSMSAAREKGMVRSEGKEYVVQDGDVILFRFNV
jgi:GTP-binding protein YchF